MKAEAASHRAASHAQKNHSMSVVVSGGVPGLFTPRNTPLDSGSLCVRLFTMTPPRRHMHSYFRGFHFCLQKAHVCWVSVCFRTPWLLLGHPGSLKYAYDLKCMRMQTRAYIYVLHPSRKTLLSYTNSPSEFKSCVLTTTLSFKFPTRLLGAFRKAKPSNIFHYNSWSIGRIEIDIGVTVSVVQAEERRTTPGKDTSYLP